MILLVLLTALTSHVAAQDQRTEGPAAGVSLDGFEARNTFTGCQPVFLSIHLDDDERSTDLTEDRIQSIAESRLRSARLLAQTSDVILSVGALVVGSAFHGTVRMNQPVYVRLGHTWPFRVGLFLPELQGPVALPGAFSRATTWGADIIGTHDGDGGYILQLLSESIDTFIADYLLVNEPSCK